MIHIHHPGLRPHGEQLRKALRWLSDHHDLSRDAIEEASIRYDLSPNEEEFLLHYICEKGDHFIHSK